MRKFIIFTVIFICSFTVIFSQTTDVVVGLKGPYGLAIGGNYLYYCESDAKKVSKIDLTSNTPIPTEVVSGLDSPTGLILIDNYLYVCEVFAGTVIKVDITDSNPTPIVVASGLGGPSGFAINENYLFISEFISGKISKINLEEETPNLIEVISGLNKPEGLAIVGNDLYICESGSKKVSRIDITEENPTAEEFISGIREVYGIRLRGNYLYVCSIDDGAVYKIDITNPLIFPVFIKDQYRGPTRLFINGDDMYVSEYFTGVISKTKLEPISSVENTESPSFDVYPNPAQEYLIVNSSKLPYSIKLYNLSGDLVNEVNDIFDSHYKLDIKNLVSGCYVLNIDDEFIKFIKK